MIIRGLSLPDFEGPPDTSRLLASYLATTKDTLGDLLRSGARWPEKLGADHRSMEIFAGCRALEDEETSPSVHFSAISFAYLLYHWHLTTEAFQTLESIDVNLSKEYKDDSLAIDENPCLRSRPNVFARLARRHGSEPGDHLVSAKSRSRRSAYVPWTGSGRYRTMFSPIPKNRRCPSILWKQRGSAAR